MSYAYTPGLKVQASTIVRKRRILPLKGNVMVQQGDIVSYDTIVAKTNIPGNFNIVNVAYKLGCYTPEEILEYMVKKEGEPVDEDEDIAIRKAFFGLMKHVCKSPANGTIDKISTVSGSVIIKEPPIPVEVPAYISGKVVEIIPEEGVVIETPATFIQGIFGIGGEEHGELIIVDSTNEFLERDIIGTECAGKILICAGSMNADDMRKAVEAGVKGLIVGGVELEEMTKFLGHDITVITGEEEVGLTLIVTEGFGEMRISDRTLAILKSSEGKQASINGATQIRAGVIRPEIIIPQPDIDRSKLGEETRSESPVGGLELNTPVRIIRDPYFGAIGRIVNLPVDLQNIQTESKVRVLEVEIEDGKRAVIPRANVELIEE